MFLFESSSEELLSSLLDEPSDDSESSGVTLLEVVPEGLGDLDGYPDEGLD